MLINSIIKFYMNCGIIVVVMSIILSLMGYFLSTAQSIVGKKLNVIGWTKSKLE